MDKDGIDVQVLSINAFWYAADRDLARRMFDLQVKSSRRCVRPFPAASWVIRRCRCSFPELAAEQLEHGMKHLDLVGAAIGGSVEGEEIAASKFDPSGKRPRSCRPWSSSIRRPPRNHRDHQADPPSVLRSWWQRR